MKPKDKEYIPKNYGKLSVERISRNVDINELSLCITLFVSVFSFADSRGFSIIRSCFCPLLILVLVTLKFILS